MEYSLTIYYLWKNNTDLILWNVIVYLTQTLFISKHSQTSFLYTPLFPKNVCNNILGSFRNFRLWSETDVNKYSIEKPIWKKKKSQNSQQKNCTEVLFNKVAGLQPINFFKKCFTVNFEKFIKTNFLLNTSQLLLFDARRY